jgi:hypothetical protein
MGINRQKEFADAAQHSCEALSFAGDAIMTDTEAFCAALGPMGRT